MVLCQERARAVCGSVESAAQTPGRAEQLVDSLELPKEDLTPNQFQQLIELLEEYSDVFALTDSELGCTDILNTSLTLVTTVHSNNNPIEPLLFMVVRLVR